jgi:nucleoside-diphosphate-sugar epimerase
VRFLDYPTDLYKDYMIFYTKSFYIISIVCLIAFYFTGFYTHTRSYRSQYKAWTIFRAVTLSYLAFTFISYFILKYSFIPRGVTLLAWAITLLTVGGTRLSKDVFLRYFKIERKKQSLKSSRKIENILVVGGAGYIGSVLVKSLCRENYKVRVLDSLMYGDQPLKDLYKSSKFEFVKGDFRNVEYVVKTIKDMDAVIHLGAIVGDPACTIDEDLSLEINTAATMLIRQVCKGYGIKKFIYASTCSVYGATDEIIDERSALNPISLYARSKIEAEKAVMSMRDSHFSPTIMRISTAFGQSFRPRFDLVVNLLTAKAIKEGKISIFNGFQWRPFIHVEDISNAILMLLDAPVRVIGNEIFNIGSNHMNFQIADIGKKIKNIIPEVEVAEIRVDEDPRNYRVSFDKFRDRLGFTCKKSLEEGIIEIKNVFEKGLISDYKASQYNNLDLIKEKGLEKDQSPFKITIS